MAKELLFVLGLLLVILCIVFVIVSVITQVMQYIIAKNTGKLYKFNGGPAIILWSVLIWVAILSWRYLVM